MADFGPFYNWFTICWVTYRLFPVIYRYFHYSPGFYLSTLDINYDNLIYEQDYRLLKLYFFCHLDGIQFIWFGPRRTGSHPGEFRWVKNRPKFRSEVHAWTRLLIRVGLCSQIVLKVDGHMEISGRPNEGHNRLEYERSPSWQILQTYLVPPIPNWTVKTFDSKD